MLIYVSIHHDRCTLQISIDAGLNGAVCFMYVGIELLSKHQYQQYEQQPYNQHYSQHYQTKQPTTITTTTTKTSSHRTYTKGLYKQP